MTKIEIVSFGYGHGEAPKADFTFDVRDRFRDPHIDPKLRNMTGLDIDVWNKVESTPGVIGYIQEIAFFLDHLTTIDQSLGVVSVAFGCVGGRHRSVVMAIMLHNYLSRHDLYASVSHRDIDKSVIVR